MAISADPSSTTGIAQAANTTMVLSASDSQHNWSRVAQVWNRHRIDDNIGQGYGVDVLHCVVNQCVDDDTLEHSLYATDGCRLTIGAC